MTSVKICGLSTPDTLDVALDAGADYVGFVFFAPSPRNLSLAVARELAARVQGRAKTVALTVDADDSVIDDIIEAIAPDFLQLHGSETPERVATLRARTGRDVWKAIGVSSRDDVLRAKSYAEAVDKILFDAKPPRDASLPGGNGAAFDWTLLGDAASLPKDWMLSGGLDPTNVVEALRITGAPAVDVSSGVESASGVKDAGLIRAFIAAVRGVSPTLRSR